MISKLSIFVVIGYLVFWKNTTKLSILQLASIAGNRDSVLGKWLVSATGCNESSSATAVIFVINKTTIRKSMIQKVDTKYYFSRILISFWLIFRIFLFIVVDFLSLWFMPLKAMFKLRIGTTNFLYFC